MSVLVPKRFKVNKNIPITKGSEEFLYVRGDTGPHIKLYIYDSQVNEPADLQGAEATLFLKSNDTGKIVSTVICDISPASSIDGVLVIKWKEGDLDLPEGYYYGEVEVVYASNERETVYDLIRIYIREDFG